MKLTRGGPLLASPPLSPALYTSQLILLFPHSSSLYHFTHLPSFSFPNLFTLILYLDPIHLLRLPFRQSSAPLSAYIDFLHLSFILFIPLRLFLYSPYLLNIFIYLLPLPTFPSTCPNLYSYPYIPFLRCLTFTVILSFSFPSSSSTSFFPFFISCSIKQIRHSQEEWEKHKGAQNVAPLRKKTLKYN